MTNSGKQEQFEKQTCILVLGMHRSGTSAVTRVLSLMGATLPHRLMGAGRANISGHWEPAALCDFNDQLLSDIGSSWKDWQGPDFSRLAPGQTATIQNEILSIIKEDYGTSPLFVVKEPRICRLATLYIETLQSANIDVVPVLVLRNPIEVVASLMDRYEMWRAAMPRSGAPKYSSEFDSYMLWLRHIIDAERATRGMKRVVVSYDSLLADWQKSVEAIKTQTGVVFPNSEQAISELIDDFLSPKQRHHSYTSEEVSIKSELRGLIQSSLVAYRRLEVDPNDANAIIALDAVHNSLQMTLPSFVKLVMELNTIRAEKEATERSAQEELNRLKGALANAEDKVSGLVQSEAELKKTIERMAFASHIETETSERTP